MTAGFPSKTLVRSRTASSLWLYCVGSETAEREAALTSILTSPSSRATFARARLFTAYCRKNRECVYLSVVFSCRVESTRSVLLPYIWYRYVEYTYYNITETPNLCLGLLLPSVVVLMIVSVGRIRTARRRPSCFKHRLMDWCVDGTL